MSKPILQLVVNYTRRAIAETQPRFNVELNGKVVGELYFNLRGYVGYLPCPDGTMLDIGEKGITAFKREAAKLNKQWNAAGKVAYYEIRLNRTKPINDTDTAKQIADMRNNVQVACKPFPSLSSEEAVKDAVASNSFTNHAFDAALASEKVEESERKLVQGVCRLEEAEYWTKRLVQH